MRLPFSKPQLALLIFLVIILLLLQRSLWFSHDNFAAWHKQHHDNVALAVHNEQLKHRNALMYKKILSIRHNKAAVAKIARENLGMIKKGEQYYYVVSKDQIKS